jgi:hypothetical protein
MNKNQVARHLLAFAATAALVGSPAGYAAAAPAAAPAPASAASSPEIQALQDKLDLEKQRNTLQADLLASQKALIDAQKASVDSQTQLLGSQKSLLDAMFPQITGGKTGAVTFDASTNIGPLAQPGATEALNALAGSICKAVVDTKSTSVVLATDADLKLLAQARWINLQLAGLTEGYASVAIAQPTGAQTTNAFPPGLALYGIGAALKEVASFAQLFRTDTTIYSATVKIDQDSLNAAVAGCLRNLKVAEVFLPKALLVNSLTFPSTSAVQDSLLALEKQRGKADTELNTLAGKPDDVSKRRIARLTALNTSMDAVISSLFATSEKSPEPLLVGVLAGEAMQRKIGGGTVILQTTLSSAAAAGIKRTSLWRSDRLYSWATVTVNYALFDSSGNVIAAGAAQNSPEGRKIEVAP